MGPDDLIEVDSKALLRDLLKETGLMSSEKRDLGDLIVIVELLSQNKELMKQNKEIMEENQSISSDNERILKELKSLKEEMNKNFPKRSLNVSLSDTREHTRVNKSTKDAKILKLKKFIGGAKRQKRLIQLLHERKEANKGPIKLEKLANLTGYDKRKDGRPSTAKIQNLNNATRALRKFDIIISQGKQGYELCEDKMIINFLSSVF